MSAKAGRTPCLQRAARVASGYGCPAPQIYQATEGFLGISCEHGTLHLNEDLVHVEREVIDQSSGRFTPVITDLYRTTQAIIRYRLNDVLLPGVPECPCGSAFATVARVDDNWRCSTFLASFGLSI